MDALDNSEIARIFYEIAEYLELQGVAFKPKAYQRAASAIEGLDKDLIHFYRENKLREIPGIGEAIEEKIRELLETGKLEYLDRLRGEMPEGLLKLLAVPGIGPKTAMVLFKELGISSVEELRKAVLDHRLQDIKGFGKKSEEKILQGIEIVESQAGRSLLGRAMEIAEEIVYLLRSSHPENRFEVAGSLRRMKETIGDIDILSSTEAPGDVMRTFTSMKGIKEILASGETKSSIRTAFGIQVDLRVVPKASFGAALQYFTGSKEHNIELRKLAISKGMKINEYGLFNRGDEVQIAGPDEAEIYRSIGLQFIPPELRENRGEILAAQEGKLPKIVGYDELKGDLHCHTDWSDGGDSIESMRRKAGEMGYEYIAITDHSRSLRIGNGLSEERLLRQSEEIRRIRDASDGPFLFAGSEVDLLSDGSLDYPKSVIASLDFVTLSIHSRFKMDENEMTRRIISGFSNEKVKVFSHPTGRIIGQRQEYTFDFEAVLDAAKGAGIAMEVNCYPERLDLNDVNIRRTIDAGVKISINTDAHDASDMNYSRYGIATARRGWAKAEDVLNTATLSELRKEWGL